MASGFEGAWYQGLSGHDGQHHQGEQRPQERPRLEEKRRARDQEHGEHDVLPSRGDRADSGHRIDREQEQREVRDRDREPAVAADESAGAGDERKRHGWGKGGGPGWDRTSDQTIMSRLL